MHEKTNADLMVRNLFVFGGHYGCFVCLQRTLWMFCLSSEDIMDVLFVF